MINLQYLQYQLAGSVIIDRYLHYLLTGILSTVDETAIVFIAHYHQYSQSEILILARYHQYPLMGIFCNTQCHQYRLTEILSTGQYYQFPLPHIPSIT